MQFLIYSDRLRVPAFLHLSMTADQQNYIHTLQQLTTQIQNHTVDPISAVILAATLRLPGTLDWKLQFYHWYEPIIKSLHITPVSETLILFFWPVFIFIPLVILIYLLYRLLKLILSVLFKLFSNKTVAYTLLELTFPSDTSKSAFATEQLYRQMHLLGRQQTLIERVSKYKKLYSLEIVATKKEGIRYIIHIPMDEKDIFKRSLLSYLPGIKIREIPDYLKHIYNEASFTSITELKLSGHHALPLTKHKALSEHDLIAFLAGNMTKLKDGELLSYQIVTTPILSSVHGYLTREMNHLRRNMYQGKLLTPTLNNGTFNAFTSLPVISILFFLLKASLYICMGILGFILDGIKILVSNQSTSAAIMMSQPKVIPQEILNPYEQELSTVVKEKIDQNQFESSVRLLIIGNDTEDVESRMSGLLAAFGPMSSVYQSLTGKGSFLPRSILINKRLNQFKKRLLSPNLVFNQNPILSTSEISDLYHFPYENTTRTEDMTKILSKELPVPLSLKRADGLDVVFAKNTYGGEETEIGLNHEDRRRHMMLFGQTGSGKSTLMQSMIHQDIRNGKGICVIDPHGQLADQTLESIAASHRSSDLIWFNPDDLEHLVAINLMELTPGLDKYQALREKEFICESIISLFRKVFTDSFTSNPHRVESILRNTIHTAFTVDDATLFTIYDLLTDPVFRAKTVGKLTDERLQKFWKNLYAKAGNWQQIKMISPVTSRIERFLFSPSAKGILEQKHSTINFDEIMDQGKILVCNVSKGKLGEDTSQVLGLLILTKIQLAALKRARVPEDERRDFYLYVDEFQNFATLSFVQMLSEARKYHLNLIIAEQSTAQQKDKQITNILFANTGTVITFKTASPQDEEMILPQFEPYVKPGEIHNLSAFHFYIKLGAMNPEEPFSGVTIPTNLISNKKEIDAMIALSNDTYAIKETEETEQEVPKQVKTKTKKAQKQSNKSSKRHGKILSPEDKKKK